MDNIFLIVIVILVLTVLVIFLIVRNQKDEKQFENQLKSDYPKPGVHDTDTDENERM